MFPCQFGGLVYFSTVIETAHIYELIEEYRAKLGLTQAEVAYRAIGQDSSAAIQGLRRGRSPGIERLSAMCEVLGLELYFGPPRDTLKHDFNSLLDLESNDRKEFFFVSRFDVKLSAGPGADGNNDRQLASVAFRKDWMIQQGLNADRCGVQGISMEPLLCEGDLVLLNRSTADVRSGQIYGIVDIEGDVRIKRIERIENGIILRSEHPDCPSEVRMGEDANRVSIIGALAWSGHTHDTRRQPARGAPAPTTFKHNWL